EERFGLIYHHETRLQAGYELLVAKSGPRLSVATPSTTNPTATKGPAIEVKNGVPRFTEAAGSGQLLYGSTVIWRGRSKTTDGLAADLGNNLHLPVTDATGLAGQYDYTLTFTAGTNSPFAVAPSPGEDVPAGATPQPAYPLLFDALKQELGLYLQPAKNIPVDVTVIDHANKEPTPN
ncbi:MAG TPA: TIGR03435 family protein, partial [Acidobacteriaceae bacterium]|nr:TIGR03435 family protein [Acidobacteriaceae bacterium]